MDMYISNTLRALIRNRAVFILLIVTFSPQVLALSFNARGGYEHWNSGLGGVSRAVFGGVGANHALTDRFFLSGALSTGTFNTDSISESDILRVDFDVNVHYRLDPFTTVYSGIQLIRLDVDNIDDDGRSFKDNSSGLGIGVLRYFHIDRAWTLYGGFFVSGVLATSYLNAGDEVDGSGFSSGINGGAIYTLSKDFSIAAGLKTRLTSVDYGGDYGIWSHNMQRLTIGVIRTWR